MKIILRALCLLLLGALVSCHRPPKDPNVVVIVIDTLRADHLPFYGYENNTAPFLWELTKRGVVFEKTYSTSSWTAPATASIVTGLYPFQHGVVMGFQATKRIQKLDPAFPLNRIPEEVDTLAEILKRDGYRTFGITDNRNISKDEGFDQGFDQFENHRYAGAKKVNAIAQEWKSEIKQGKYFLYLHYMDPHDPYNQRAPWYHPVGTRAGDMLAAYDSEIQYVDQKIQELYELFGWDKNTLVIVTSDHGEEFFEHGQRGHGKALYNESIQVPLVLSYPSGGIQPASIGAKVSLVDIVPTVRGLLGISAGSYPGFDLSPLLRGKQLPELEQRSIYAHLYKRRPNGMELEERGTLQDRWKHIGRQERQWKTESDWQAGEEQLFDLIADPSERGNRFSDKPELAANLGQTYLEFEKNSARYGQTKFAMREK